METFTLFSTEHFWFIGGGFLGILALTMDTFGLLEEVF